MRQHTAPPHLSAIRRKTQHLWILGSHSPAASLAPHQRATGSCPRRSPQTTVRVQRLRNTCPGTPSSSIAALRADPVPTKPHLLHMVEQAFGGWRRCTARSKSTRAPRRDFEHLSLGKPPTARAQPSARAFRIPPVQHTATTPEQAMVHST